MSVLRALFLVAMTFASGSAAIAADTVKVYAAGSLRAVMTEIGESFANAGNPRVTLEFGASGLLRDRLAKGERADVFASANMEHLAAGPASPAVTFARNRLCALRRMIPIRHCAWPMGSALLHNGRLIADEPPGLAITPERLRTVYGVDVAIREVSDPSGRGRQVCVPAPTRPRAAS